MKRTWLTIGIILLFLGTCLIPATAQNTEKSQPTSRGTWLYVGGSAPGNYTRIQDAINDSHEGDTVFVYNGTYSTHDINIPKSITLKGENRNTTIIDFIVDEFVVGIGVVRGVIQITGFTIQHGDHGIFISTGRTTISDNIITHNDVGIVAYEGFNSTISNNIISENRIGIENLYGQHTYYTQNSIKNNTIGFSNEGADLQILEKNSFEGNDIAIEFQLNSQNKVLSNNFIMNKIDTKLLEPGFNLMFEFKDFLQFLLWFRVSKWEGNYWDSWRITTPKPILGFFIIYITFLITPSRDVWIPLGIYPYVRIDRHPAQEPFDIPAMRS